MVDLISSTSSLMAMIFEPIMQQKKMNDLILKFRKPMLYYTERLIKDNPDHQYCQSMYNIAKYLFKEDDVKIDFTNLNIMEDFELQPIVIKYASERIKLSINPSTISEIKLSDVRKEVLIKSILNYFRDEYFYIKDIGDTIRLGVETMLLIEPVFRLLTNTISRYEVKKYKKRN